MALRPEPPASRNIVLLLDGTANRFSETNTNLIKMLSVAKADEAQLVYYSSGVGTVLPDSTSMWGQFKQKAAKVADMALAWNFDQFVCDAYKYLMDFYKTGDKIYLFGFSRGAYTARALAGMIQRIGLLPAGCHNQIGLAYEIYTGLDPESHKKHPKDKDPSVLYRRIFSRSRPVLIEFMGIWDTVSSIGGFDLDSMPFAGGAKSIKFIRHALALDERRVRFAPEYLRKDAEEQTLRSDFAKLQKGLKTSPDDKVVLAKMAEIEDDLQTRYPTSAVTVDKKTMKKNIECWFMGCHSDVGGGNTLNDDPSLSNIPFRWMLREAVRCGMLLDPEGVAFQIALHLPLIAVDPSDQTPQNLNEMRGLLEEQAHDAREEAEQEPKVERLRKALPHTELARVVELVAALDTAALPAAGAELISSSDAKADITESLVGAWLAMEVLILKTRRYDRNGDKEEEVMKINHGEPRQILPSHKCHRSVLRRLLYDAGRPEGNTYPGPAAKVGKGWPEWSDIKRGRANHSHIWLE